MSKHTPTPWMTEPNEKSGVVYILGARTDGNVRQSDGMGELAEVDCCDGFDDRQFPDMNPEDAANAAHIVLCVNAHDGLVAALECVMSLYGAGFADDVKATVRAALQAAHD